MKTRCVWYVIGACVFTVGCSTTPKQAKLPRTGNTVEDAKVAIQQGPARDKVLWQYRGAIAAMREGHYDEAKQMLDDALRTVGGIIGPNKEGKRARSNFVAESKKTFIGEPYERVMAYFYRGILYWRDGELDNARACFLSAQFQDADAEKNEYKSDYVLLDYLAGLASAKLGGDGQDAFQRAQALNKSNPLPPYDPKANVIFFVELGYGPSKFATGQYAQQLRFRPGSSDSRAAGISLGKSAMQATCCDDLSFQATTRGGRVMDHVLANKAMFKSTAGTVGDVALVAGMATASSGIIYSNTDASIAGAALLAVALIAKGIEKATNPAADTRQWDNLPQYLGFAAVRLPPGQHQGTVEFLDESGIPFADLQTVSFTVGPPPKDTVVLITDRPKNPWTK